MLLASGATGGGMAGEEDGPMLGRAPNAGLRSTGFAKGDMEEV